jgi:hypothetical protein
MGIGVKFEQIPRIGNVESDYAFEILLRTYTLKLRFCPVARACEQKNYQTILAAYANS